MTFSYLPFSIKGAQLLNRRLKVCKSSQKPKFYYRLNIQGNTFPTFPVIVGMTTQPKYTIKGIGGHDYVPLEDIMRFEGAGNYTDIHVEGHEKPIEQSSNLGVHAARLAKFPGFVRIQKSHIVNVNYIVRKDIKGHVVLENGEEIPYQSQHEPALATAMDNI